MKRFVSEPIEPIFAESAGSQSSVPGQIEPLLPAAFVWRHERIDVGAVLKTWRTTKDDRGDTYLKRHWFEFQTGAGGKAIVYFDRAAKRGSPRWFLFSIEPVV